MSRLFFALCPDVRVRAEIQAKVRAIPLVGGRQVAEKNTHITLAFLGSVDEQTSAALIMAAADLRIAPFSLRLDQIGWWSKPKIAWLAPSRYPAALPRLAAALGMIAQDCGLTPDERPFRPHLTLARKGRRPDANILLTPISWNINEFCLLESIPAEKGVEYKVKRSWPLKIM